MRSWINQFWHQEAHRSTDHASPVQMERLENRELFAANPLVGKYAGTMTRAVLATKFPAKISVTAKKGGKVAFSAVLTESGLGEVDFNYTFVARSDGSFSVGLGSTVAGTISGRLSGTKLILVIHEAGRLAVNGTLKRS